MAELRKCGSSWAFCDGNCSDCWTIATKTTQPDYTIGLLHDNSTVVWQPLPKPWKEDRMDDIKVRVIDSKKLIEAINTGSYEINLSAVMALGAVATQSAQPERKKGKWIDNTYCSECGWVHETDSGFIGSVDGFNFCPQCGADMRKDGEHHEGDD